MADWKCLSCGWTNGGSRTYCMKCGLDRITEEDFCSLENGKSEINKVLPEIEQHRSSLAPKWEYSILSTGLNADKNWIVYYSGKSYPYNQLNYILDEMGAQGWELVGVSSDVGSEKPWLTTVSFTYTAGEHFYLKRPCTSLPEDLQKQIKRIIEEVPPKLRSKLPPLH
jgi:hypothetical protein